MGPTTSVANILQKLSVIFSTVASFDVLMQNFYKFMQANNEKVPSFAMRLEGTLNQIRLQYPGRMMDLKVQQHLKDSSFTESGGTYITPFSTYITLPESPTHS